MTDRLLFAEPAGFDGVAPFVLAYVGPGAGLAAIGALLTMAGVAVFMLVGFVWYPMQRLLAVWRRHGEGAGAAKHEDRYSPADRFLHRMAFAAVPAQKALADLEDRLYARRIDGVRIERPVFIASLPRAGTTLLLETLGLTDAFATHTYRHMPFLFVPLLWNAISRRFHLAGGDVERAHGDGMTIRYDSAEAFEEALWRAFHRSRYLPDRILPWPEDGLASAGFDAFIRNHVRKLIALRTSGEGNGRPVRYLSKNNGNLARVATITRLFPDAAVLVPFRNPADHAASMLRQHLRFEKIHAAEAFTRRYMEDAGHFDFGANLRPIDFDHWLDGTGPATARGANFWLRYWCAAFGHVLANPAAGVVLVDYDGLCAEPAPALRRIADRIGLAGAEALAGAAGRFRAPTRYDVAAPDVDGALLEKASALHRELLRRSRD